MPTLQWSLKGHFNSITPKLHFFTRSYDCMYQSSSHQIHRGGASDVGGTDEQEIDRCFMKGKVREIKTRQVL